MNETMTSNPKPLRLHAHPRRPAATKVAATVAVTTLVAILMTAWTALPASGEEVNRIVLRVNDEIATLRDYERRKAGQVNAILAAPQLSPSDRQERIRQLGPILMQQIFQELLITSRADQMRERITDREVDDAVRSMMEERGIPDEATLNQALEASGMTLKDLREKTRRDMLMNQVIGREVSSEIDVGEEELRAIYRNNESDFTTPERRWLKEVIVLESSGQNEEELRRLADEVRDRLRAGGELEEIIAPYEEEGLTTGVIDLDWLTRDELESTLADVAFELEPGTFSEPVASRGGLHVLHLAGLEEAKVLPFDEVQSRILGRERSRRFNEELRDYLTELEATAYVFEDLPLEAVGYRSLVTDYSPEREIELIRNPELPPREKPEAEGDEEPGS